MMRGFWMLGLLVIPVLVNAEEFAAKPEWRDVPKMRWLEKDRPVRELLYEGESLNGQPTEVFAFYATPGTLSGDTSRDRHLPAVVLIHGGGGTAFAEWVQLWAQRGYAAIAMDLSGHRPESPQWDATTKQLTINKDHRHLKRERLPNGGPDQGHGQKFDSIGGDTSDDWPLHAVAAVMKAHSLIRSFPEVDPEKTAVTGISWGGYTTCLVASLDDRFKAAVPIYGCGYLHEGESVQKPAIDRLPDDQRAEWIRRYDPSSHLAKCRVPILFVNGTNDVHYVLDSYAKSYSLVKGPRTIRIEVNMPHGHPSGWAPAEIGLFIDSHLKSGQPLAKLAEPQLVEGKVQVAYTAAVPLKTAHLHYTTDTGLRSDRKWQTISATIEPAQLVAPSPPEAANTWFLTATDERGALVSTTVQFAE